MPVTTSTHKGFPLPGATTGDKRINDIRAVKDALVAIDALLHGINVNNIASLVLESLFTSPVTLTISGDATISSEAPKTYAVTVTQFSTSAALSIPITTNTPGVTVLDGRTIVVDPAVANDTVINLHAEMLFNGRLCVATLPVTVANSGGALDPSYIAPYYGVAADPGTITEAFVLTLASRGSIGTRVNSHITMDSQAGQYMWYAYPKNMGLATFTDLSTTFEGGFDGAAAPATGPAEVTVNGVVFYVYRSDNADLGVCEYSVS